MNAGQSHRKLTRLLLIFCSLLIFSVGCMPLPAAAKPTSQVGAPAGEYPAPEVVAYPLASEARKRTATKPYPGTAVIATSHEIHGGFIWRQTRAGNIVETGYSRFSSMFFMINQWYGSIDELKYHLVAGALQGDAAMGGKGLLKPWPGILTVEVRDASGTLVRELGGSYQVPESGPLRIVEQQDRGLVVIGEYGSAYVFDLDTREFSRISDSAGFQRQSEYGAIFETGNVPVPLANTLS